MNLFVSFKVHSLKYYTNLLKFVKNMTKISKKLATMYYSAHIFFTNGKLQVKSKVLPFIRNQNV